MRRFRRPMDEVRVLTNNNIVTDRIGSVRLKWLCVALCCYAPWDNLGEAGRSPSVVWAKILLLKLGKRRGCRTEERTATKLTGRCDDVAAAPVDVPAP